MSAPRVTRLVVTVGAVAAALALVAVVISSQSHDASALQSVGASEAATAASGVSAGDTSTGAADQSLVQSTNPSSDAPVVVAIGDSIMDGHGVDPDQAWPVLVAEQKDWQLTNLSADGAGFAQAGDNGGTFAQQAAQAVELDPSIVIISASSNDLGEDSASIADATSVIMASLRSALPHAQIIALSAFWGDTTPPGDLTEIDTDMQSAAAAVGATYVDIGQPLTDQPGLMQDDDVHPTAAGLAVLASAIAADLPAS